MRKSVNKSALIREVHAKNPSLSASEIVALLKKEGTPVSAPLVYQTIAKSKSAKKADKKRGPKPKVANVAVTFSDLSSDELFTSLQQFVTAAGGLDKAIAILNIFKQ